MTTCMNYNNQKSHRGIRIQRVLSIQTDLIPGLSFFFGMILLAVSVQFGEYILPYFSYALYLGSFCLILLSKRIFLVGFLSIFIIANDITPPLHKAKTLYDLSISSFSIPSLTVLLFLILGFGAFTLMPQGVGDRHTRKTLYLMIFLFLFGLLIGIVSRNSFREMVSDASIFLTPIASCYFIPVLPF